MPHLQSNLQKDIVILRDLRYFFFYLETNWVKAKYKDGSSGLNYADKFVFAYIKTISRPIVEQYLGLRKITPPGSK